MNFWLMHGAIVAIAGVVILAIAPLFRRVINAEPAKA